VPGFYGQGSTTFFGGSGRLAKPKFETKVTFGVGYDDNLFQTPSSNTPQFLPGASQIDSPEPPLQLIDPGGEPIFETHKEFVGGGAVVERRVQVGVTQPVFGPVETVPEGRTGSFFTRIGLGLEMQSYTRRSLFTFDLNANQSYYWEREKDPAEYNGSFDLKYLYRFTPRLQLTTQVNTAYISQPDLSRVNTPQRQTQGDLINGLVRMDLAYRITPRLSLSLTGNFSGNRYTEKVEQIGDFNELTFGLEARYLWKARWTLLAEYRHGMTDYLNRDDLDASTNYLLVGSEFIISPRLSGSLRMGEAIKTFESTGDSQSAPYVESSVTYRSTARSSVQWNNRFGFEEPASPDEERLVYRSTISYNYAFTPHLRATVGANLLHEITTSQSTDVKTGQDTVEISLGFEYEMTRRFNLNGSYTFTLVNTNTGLSDYYRDRVFFGGEYTF
jgi:hypothetical protein